MPKMRLRRVSVTGVATWHALYAFIFAIFLGLFYCSYVYLWSGHLQSRTLFYYLLIIPITYPLLAFIAYAVIALLYNSLSRTSGGILLELEPEEHQTPPPPPIY